VLALENMDQKVQILSFDCQLWQLNVLFLMFFICCQQNFYGRTISVEIAKPGWDHLGIRPRPPRASGPPKKWNLPEEQGEEVDCWYWSNFKLIKL
jgi:hypothetical protein